MNLQRLKIFVTRWTLILILVLPLSVLWLLRRVEWKLGDILNFSERQAHHLTLYFGEMLARWEKDTPEHTMETLRKEYTEDNL